MASAPLPGIGPLPWTNQDVALYHGTTLKVANDIVNRRASINPALGSHLTDFGQGFYTTTLLRQARTWAWDRAQRAGVTAAVIAFCVGRDALAPLETLTFVRGDFGADDFWSFVFHCRAGTPDHGRGHATPRYDLVVGPVAAFWQQRLLLQDCDQISFHTLAAARILNAATKTLIHVP